MNARRANMFTVALVGADGSGKSTVSRRIEQESSLPIKYVYMGINLDTSRMVLPTTRLIYEFKRLRGGPTDMGGPPGQGEPKPRSRNPIIWAVQEAKSALRVANLMAEEWFRQVVVWFCQIRGYIVIFDRHFFSDYYAHDVTGKGKSKSFARKFHGLTLKHFYPKPDLMICLDAPAEVLFARKSEGTVALLERRRQEYLSMRHIFDQYAVVDATQSEDEVTRQVVAEIQDFHQRRLDNATQRRFARGRNR